MPSGLASHHPDLHGELGKQTRPWRMQGVVGQATAIEGRITGVLEDSAVRHGHGDLSAIG